MVEKKERKHQGRILEQIRLGKEGYPSYRAQYISSRRVNSVTALAKIWGITRRAVNAAKAKDAGTDRDWDASREIYQRDVSQAYMSAIKRDAEEEMGGVISQFQAVVGLFARRVTVEVGSDKPLDPSKLAALWRVFDGARKAYDSLSGYERIQEIAEERKRENQWFLRLIEEHVQDPDTIKRMATAVRDRMVLFGRSTNVEYTEQNESMDSTRDVMSAAQAELVRAEDELKGRERIKIRQVKPDAGKAQKPRKPVSD